MYCALHAAGGTGPPLVYVPGIDGTGEMLLGTARRLERRFHLVRLRYGADDAAGDDTYERCARSLTRVLDELDIPRAVLLAESFGGGVALQAALDYAERVAALAIVNGFAHFRGHVRLRLAWALAPLVPPVLFGSVRGAIAPWMLFGGKREAEAIRRFRAEPGTWFGPGYRRRLAMIRRLDLRPRLGEIACPVRLFAGTKDRIVDSPREALAIAERLPDAGVRLVEGGGHLILPLAGLPWPAWLAELAQHTAVA